MNTATDSEAITASIEIDYTATITSLNTKAKNCNKIVAVFAIALLTAIVSLVVYFTYQPTYQGFNQGFNQGTAGGFNWSASTTLTSSQATFFENPLITQGGTYASNTNIPYPYNIEIITTPLLNRIQQNLVKIEKLKDSKSQEDVANIKFLNEDTSNSIEQLEKTTKLINNTKNKLLPQNPSSIYTSLLVDSIKNIGAVGLALLLAQILVMFMRYYARLGQLYYAQADALSASGGNTEAAYKFMEHFSPNTIELGKSPSSIYEKALDAVAKVNASGK